MKDTTMQNLIKQIIELTKKERFSVLVGLLACFYYFYPRPNGIAAIIHFFSFALYILIVFFWWWYTITRFARCGLSKDKKWYQRIISLSLALILTCIIIYLMGCIILASWIIAIA